VITTPDGRRQWIVEGRPWAFVGTPPGRESVYTRAGVAEEPEPGVFRATTARLRCEDMDRDRVDVELINGPYELLWNIQDPELRAACYAGFNDWAKELYDESGGRLIVLFPLPSLSAEEAVRELERVAKFGMPTGVIFDWAHAPKPVWDEMWEPLWAAAAETGMPINFHIGGGVRTAESLNPYRNQSLTYAAVFTMQTDEVMAGLIYSGVPDRHPNARFVFEESGIGWVAYLMYRLDREYEGPFPTDTKLSLKPSEFLRRQFYFTFEDEDPVGLKRIPEVGSDRFMWASDYPGADSPWPHSQDHAITPLREELGEEMTRKLTFENVVNLYALDRVAVAR
jgi:predicted TIM-barrel fold metal-dependent hydrolase